MEGLAQALNVGALLILLGIWGGAIWIAVAVSQRTDSRLVGNTVVTMGVFLPAVLIAPKQVYFAGLCRFESGVEISHPDAGISGLVVDPQPIPECSDLCYALIAHDRGHQSGFAFVELEVRPDTDLDPEAEYGSALLPILLGEAGEGEFARLRLAGAIRKGLVHRTQADRWFLNALHDHDVGGLGETCPVQVEQAARPRRRRKAG